MHFIYLKYSIMDSEIESEPFLSIERLKELGP